MAHQQLLSAMELAIHHFEVASANSPIDFETVKIAGRLAHRLVRICDAGAVQKEQDINTSVKRRRGWEREATSLWEATEEEWRGLPKRARMVIEIGRVDDHNGGEAVRVRDNGRLTCSLCRFTQQQSFRGNGVTYYTFFRVSIQSLVDGPSV